MRVPKPIHFARSLAVALMVAVAVTAFATAVPAAEGPILPPAEYKPLPVGTKISYDNKPYSVSADGGRSTRCALSPDRPGGRVDRGISDPSFDLDRG